MFPILSHIDWERLGEQSDAVCECLVYVRVSFFFFLKTIYFWKTVVVVPFWAPRMYTFAVKKKKVPPNMLNALQRLLMGVSFFSFFFSFSIAVFLVAFTCLLGEQVSCGAQVAVFQASCIKHSGCFFFSFFLLIPLRQSLPTELFIQFTFFFPLFKVLLFLKSRQMYCICCGSPRHCLRETAPFDSKAVMKRHRRHVLGLARD